MSIVVLTGAGVSAESGVQTFRGGGGLWEGYDVTEVATPEAYANDPDLVLRFYDQRRRAVSATKPNAAHVALAKLEAELGDDLLVITQNVDDLHERAGSRRVLHMHGTLNTAWCTGCDERSPITNDLLGRPACPHCGKTLLRPDVVWFGEYPYGLDRIDDALSSATTFAAIGTSGVVYPAAGFVMAAREYGASTAELNLETTGLSDLFDDSRQGPASQIVPGWVDEILNSWG